MPTKFIVILGSLMSGLGKGIASSSIMKILDFYDYKVLPVKFDGYLNYDCGTMNPFRHGEVFVFDDKSEVDMDFGMYERFLDKSLTGENSITGGKLFSKIIQKERKGDFLGRDVQIIPHLTDMIIENVMNIAETQKPEVLVIEVGGTVGDIENGYFIEAMRQLSLKEKVVFVDVTYVPKLSAVGEQKTKPTQLAYRAMMQSGIHPDYILCRCEEPLEDEARNKIALFTSLNPERVIDDGTLSTLYSIPLHFMKQKLDTMLIEQLQLENKNINKGKLDDWKARLERTLNPAKRVRVAVVGKYIKLHDSYISVKESLVHAGAAHNTGIDIKWVESELLEKGDANKELEGIDGIIVPGGFGKRGIEGMINAIQYAREKHIPYMGLCLGMQLMAIEFARNVCKLDGASSSEFDPDAKHKVIDIMEEQKSINEKGGTMRLGAWECKLHGTDTIAYKAYKKEQISERHRHRYEFNNQYKDRMTDNGLIVSGTTTDGKLVEFIEWKNSFGIGTQAHPELKSRFCAPAPLFLSFVDAAITKHYGVMEENISTTSSKERTQ